MAHPPYKHFYPYQSPLGVGTSNIGQVRCHIKWEPDIQSYSLSCPNPDYKSWEVIKLFKEQLKNFIPGQERQWDDVNKRWLFDEKYFTGVLSLTKLFWRNPTEVKIETKDDVEAKKQTAATTQQRQLRSTRLEPLDKTIERFVCALPTEAVKLLVIPNKSLVEVLKSLKHDEAKKVYRRAVWILHPDRNQGDKEKTAKLAVINECWSKIEHEVFNVKKGASST